MKAIGIHVFAGGFTQGVMRVFDVVGQMEVHGLGKETVEQQLGLPFVMPEEGKDVVESWLAAGLHKGCDFAYGNPRCTGFSVLNTAKETAGARGPWAAQNIDILQFCDFVIKAGIPVACWESVQQAYTTGRPLLDKLRDEVFVPAGYRIVHVLLNAATFGSAQHRKRYFFVAYKKELHFPIVVPPLPERHTTVRDVIGDPELMAEETKSTRFLSQTIASANTWCEPRADNALCIPHLKQGESLNDIHILRPKTFRAPGMERMRLKSLLATGDMPFGMHSITRLEWDGACPVLTGSCGAMIHPELDRGCTLRELALLMGWNKGVTPLGLHQTGQIGKGIVPAVGQWIAEMAATCVASGPKEPRSESEVLMMSRTGAMEVIHAMNPVERVVDLTDWCPPRPRPTRYWAVGYPDRPSYPARQNA